MCDTNENNCQQCFITLNLNWQEIFTFEYPTTRVI